MKSPNLYELSDNRRIAERRDRTRRLLAVALLAVCAAIATTVGIIMIAILLEIVRLA
jgi:hypothetical protein